MSRAVNRSNLKRITWIERNVSFIRENKDQILEKYDLLKDEKHGLKPHEVKYIIEYISLKISTDDIFAEKYFEHIKPKDTQPVQTMQPSTQSE